MDVRLVGMHIQPRSSEMTAFQRLYKGFFVHEHAASCIDEARTRLEVRQEVSGNEFLAAERGGEDYAVGSGDELLHTVTEGRINGFFHMVTLTDHIVLGYPHAQRGVDFPRD